MNRLRIVIEETEPGVYVCRYVGRDAGLAQAALGEPSANCLALFNYPHVTKYNRQILPGQATELPVEVAEELPAEEVPIEGGAATEPVDEAAEAVTEEAPRKRRKK